MSELYSAPGLESYRPEAVLARRLDGGSIPALCYNLPEPLQESDRNASYAVRLQENLRGLDFPDESIESIASR